jgi:hypothetical protein
MQLSALHRKQFFVTKFLKGSHNWKFFVMMYVTLKEHEKERTQNVGEELAEKNSHVWQMR